MAASFCRRSFLNYKNCLFQTQKRTGYVVLIPETPKEVAECNITSLENLPNFSKLNSDSCKHIVHKYAQMYDSGSWELEEHLVKTLKETDSVDPFKHIIEPLEVLSVPFASSWGVAKTLFISDRELMPYSTFYILSERVSQIRYNKYNMEPFFSACKKALESRNEEYTEEQRRILQKFVWEGIHNGLNLTEKDRQELKDCFLIIENKKVVYENKLKNSKRLFRQIITDEKFGEEAPLALLRETSATPETPEKGPWLITLKDFVYKSFLENCSSRDARRHIWTTYNQVASMKLDITCNAVSEVEDIRRERRKFAKMLGYSTYAHVSMKTKMADNVENVQNVLSLLLDPAKSSQEKEVFELEKFAYLYDFRGSLEPWDLSYWMKMERKHKFHLDEAVLIDYFPLSQVLLGLIALCEQLFSIEIEEQSEIRGWDPDVRYFRVLDAKTKTLLGGFYFDPYHRNGKMSGDYNTGWFVAMRPRSGICASLPLSSLIFSFTPPTEDKPSLLYFREVEALFEKFALMLQFTLSQMNYSEVSGLANIEWDAVEICSSFLKCWLSEKNTLESISGHYDSGEPLPAKMLNNLANIRKQMAGTRLCRDIYYSNLDLEIHLKEDGCMDIAERLWPEHFLFQLQRNDFHPFGFSEIFARPWGSSYYSHVWSRMVATDIFTAFVEAGFSSHEEISVLGNRFRSTFLSSGGGRAPGEVFKSFRGRDPNPTLLTDFLSLNKPETPTPTATLAPELALA